MRWNLLLAGVAASWGLVSVIVAGVELSGYALVFWRCLLGSVSLPLILLATRRAGSLRLDRHRGRVLLLGLLLALHWILFFETVKRSSVAVAILTVYTAPVFVAIVAPVLLGDGEAAWRSRRSRSPRPASP
jgi:drug/metabolite transporter (DMT)-like permease